MTGEVETKDALLRDLLEVLAARGLVTAWAASARPFSDLERDCRSVCADAEDRQALAAYLQRNRVIQESVTTLLASFAITANARLEAVPAIQRPLARAGS